MPRNTREQILQGDGAPESGTWSRELQEDASATSSFQRFHRRGEPSGTPDFSKDTTLYDDGQGNMAPLDPDTGYPTSLTTEKEKADWSRMRYNQRRGR